MSENLVIVESPGKIRKIGDYLGGDFDVKASIGHVRDLPADKISVDTKGGFEPHYTVPADKKKVVADLKAAADKAKTVWLASDEDREGEAIAWHLVETLGLKPEKTKRIVFHEITKSALQEAIKAPRDIDMNLVKAQQARRVLDRLVGYELSPVLWKKIKGGLSAGRVQSVALRLVVDREREINAFKSERFFRVEAVFSNGDTLIKAALDHRFATREEALAFLGKCKDADFKVTDVQTKEGTRTPAAPFTTSQLQQDAGRKLGFSVKQTMATAQKLYEAGLITYMRTDSTNLSSLAINTSKTAITETWGEEYSRPRNYKTKAKGAQEAHEAIRPTYMANSTIGGTAAEQKLYNLIWKRTIASQMADARVEKTDITIGGSGLEYDFLAHGEKILFDGFLKVYMESRDDEGSEETENILPSIPKGTALLRNEIVASESYTQGPVRYSEASLVKKLEELGIGRPSTYAPTISTIMDRGYIVKADKPAETRGCEVIRLKGAEIGSSVKNEKFGAEKKKLFPDNIGIAVTDYLAASFPNILDYGFTASVEEEFDKIAEGHKQWNAMIGEFYSGFHEEVEKSLGERAQKNECILGTDPATGKQVSARIARYGAVVQLGANDDPEKKFAALPKGRLLETVTLEEALHLLLLPREVATLEGSPVIAAIGPRGPYVKYKPQGGKDKFVSIPSNLSPYTITAEEALGLISAESAKVPAGPIAEFPEEGIQVISGPYGPYIKAKEGNFRIPKSCNPASLTLEQVKEIMAKGQGSKGKRPAGKFTKKNK